MICQVYSLDPNLNLERLTSLAHHRWNIMVIAELHRSSGAKFVSLVHRLTVNRGSLRASLTNLIALGFVRKNTGHGHPMRPEYLLTSQGIAIGDHCSDLVAVIQSRNEVELAFRKWTLPIVAAIGEQNLRFGQVRSSIPDATPRAITIALKSLLHEKWAARNLIDDFPPTAGYALRSKGRRILTSLGTLSGVDQRSGHERL
jgi:DNA-binding HxlR family transcriptional regulator